jgi:hypothetical protein
LNNLINRSDELGLESIQTKDCEIVIWVGHSSSSHTYSIAPRSKIGLATCDPGTTNGSIIPSNKLQGYPDHSAAMKAASQGAHAQIYINTMNSAIGGMSPARDPENEHGYENSVNNMIANVGRARKELCCAGCTSVTVNLYNYYSEYKTFAQGKTGLGTFGCKKK